MARRTTRSKITQTAGSAGSTVADTVGPALSDARDRIGPLVEEAKEVIATGVEEAKEILVPAAVEMVKTTKEQGHKAAVKAGLVDEPKKSHKLRNLLVLLGVGALVAFVYKKVAGRDSAPQWTATRDVAPTAPLPSEETVESPVPTTPDEPLEEKDL
jgi:hypothetical protein